MTENSSTSASTVFSKRRDTVLKQKRALEEDTRTKVIEEYNAKLETKE